jgi:hypothetical protein
LIAVGSLIAALFSTQLFDPDKFTLEVKWMFSGLFLFLTLLGTSTVMQLAQLRSAWHDSMMAMNQMKDFAMQQSPELANAFRWKTATLPAKYKSGSVSTYQAREVSFLGALMFGAATFFLQQAFELPIEIETWIICTAAGAIALIVQMAIYKRLLT